MKQLRHQKTHTKTDETSSNNENKKKITTMKNTETTNICGLKASPGEHTQRHAPETAPFQQSE
jgi:hypothetical protein